MPKGRDIGSAFESKRGEVERQSDSEAQNFHVTGEIQCNGAGENVVSVTFPILFVVKPSYSFGPELGPGQPAIAGQLPECSMTVLQWHENVREDGSIIYAGATFGAVTYGPATQVVTVQWHMQGVGLRGPAPGSDD